MSERGNGRSYADQQIREIIRGLMPYSNKCYNCRNFNHFTSACELWHETIKSKGECDFYEKD